MKETLSEITRQIQENSHAVVPFNITKAQFEEAIQIYVRFLSLSQEVKDQIYFKIDPDNRGSEVGYKKYRRELGHTDNREYFHYHTLAEERFQRERQKYPELDRLLEVMKRIYGEAKQTLGDVLSAFEERFPGLRSRFFPPDQHPNLYLRFLKYDREKVGEFLAKGHYDRGGCTLALAESAPGLRMGSDDQHLHEIAHQEGQALFMPGLKFPDITSSEFLPTWHDVIQKGEDVYSEDIARWAIVFFADPHGSVDITYEQAHTPKRQ